MCEYCLHYPHLPGCPNAPEPKPIYTCECCGNGIFQDDKYCASYRGPLCKECLDAMSAIELLEYVGESVKTAEADYDQRTDRRRNNKIHIFRTW